MNAVGRDTDTLLVGSDAQNPLQMRMGSDGLPFEGLGLDNQQRALLGVFERLTASQKKAFLRELEDVKRKNEEIVEELTRKVGAHGNGS